MEQKLAESTPVATGKEARADEPVTLALVGCGLVSRSHLPALRGADRVRLVAVVDLDATRAEAAAATAGGVCWMAHQEQVLEDQTIEAVAICLPHHLHAEAVERALRHGKHVFVEKPMALRLDDCARMITTAEEAGRVLAVGQVLRCRHPVRLAREAVAAGAVGRPVQTIRRRYGRRDQTTGQLEWSGDAQRSGGLLYGNGSHEVDAGLWIANGRPAEVYARAGESDPEDTRGATELSLLITLAGGGLFTLSMSRGTSQAVWDQWTTGTAGSLFLSSQALTINGESRPLPEQPEGGFKEEWEAFGLAVQAARAGDLRRPCVIGARSVWPTMVALECARESIRGGRPVRATEVDRWALYEQPQAPN